MTVRARLYDARGDDRDVDLADADFSTVDDRKLLWVDVDGRDEADLDLVTESLKLERRIARQLRRDRLRPEVVRQPERVGLRLVALQAKDDGSASLVRRDVDLVMGRNLVVTVHDGRVDAFEEFGSQLQDERDLGELDAGALMTGIVDAILGGYLREVESIEREIDRLDQVALRASGDQDTFLSSVVSLRRRIAFLRRALTPNRDALTPLLRPDFEVHGDIVQPWPGIVDRLEGTIRAVENARELLVGSFDIYLGASAQRSNDVMQTLTIVSAIALPAVVLAGVMGMNFHLPFFDDAANFFLVIGAMALLAVAILGTARWRGWI